MTTQTEETKVEQNGFQWVMPEGLDVPPDPLKLRLDFHESVVTLTTFGDPVSTTRVVSAMDVAHALSRELEVSSGLLPQRALWWTNTPDGPVVALWREPQVSKVALQERYDVPATRFTIPLPGLIFLCKPGVAPWVYAAKKRPTTGTETVYVAPLFNVFEDGRSCPGTHKYPTDVAEQPDSFMLAFFSPGEYRQSSKKHPKSLKALWKSIDGKKSYPVRDLIEHGTVKDLMTMQMGAR